VEIILTEVSHTEILNVPTKLDTPICLDVFMDKDKKVYQAMGFKKMSYCGAFGQMYSSKKLKDAQIKVSFT
jgi:hypothetical protein